MTAGPDGSNATRPMSPPAASDTGLTCLVLLAQFFEQPASADQIRHRFGKTAPFDETDILRCARELGLKASAAESEWSRLGDAVHLPVIAERKDGSFLILAKKIPDDRILVHDPLVGRPEAWPRAKLDEVWTGRIILFTSRKLLAGDARRFDIAWFIPAVVKYRRLFGEVLVASLFLQLFGLITPLFFQVIIDKVLVHRSRARHGRRRKTPFSTWLKKSRSRNTRRRLSNDSRRPSKRPNCTWTVGRSSIFRVS